MVTFFGTSHRSASFLEQAIKNGLKVDLVVSDPPKPIGKKQIITENPTVTTAKNNGINFVTKLNDLIIARGLSPKQSQDCGACPECNEGSFVPPPRNDNEKPLFPHNDMGIILDYNKIIPNEIIDLFPKGIINIHFSKLPQYRGPAPVQYTILNGDRQAWITYYLINERVDAGQILTQTSLPLDMTENTETLYQKLITKAAGEISPIIDEYLSGRSKPRSQEGTATYTKKLTLENCQIDWSKTPQEIEKLIRAAYPEPGAWTEVKLKVQSEKLKVMRLKILKAHLENGKLVLDQVQLEGKKPVGYKQFKEGYPNSKMAI